ITGDLNGWHSAWGSKSDDDRGRDIYKFIVSNGFILLNDGKTPTFDTVPSDCPRTSYIDITFVNSKALRCARNWKVVDSISISDHRLLSFQWTSAKPKIHGSLTRKFRTTNVDWTKFDQLALHKLRHHNTTIPSINDKDELLGFIESLESTVQDICSKTLPKSK